MNINKKKYFFATLLFLFLSFPFLNGASLNSAFAISDKVNPVGTNLIVEIAKKQNPAVVFVTSKNKFQPTKGNPSSTSRSIWPIRAFWRSRALSTISCTRERVWNWISN